MYWPICPRDVQGEILVRSFKLCAIHLRRLITYRSFEPSVSGHGPISGMQKIMRNPDPCSVLSVTSHTRTPLLRFPVASASTFHGYGRGRSSLHLAGFEHPGRIAILRFSSRCLRLRLADGVETRAPLALRQAPKPPLRPAGSAGALDCAPGLGAVLHLQESP